MQYFKRHKMMKRQYWIIPVLAVLTYAATALFAVQADAGIIVIGNLDIKMNHLTSTQLNGLYFKQNIGLPTGENLIAINQDSSSQAFSDFYSDVLNQDPSTVESYWSQQVFSGMNTQPPQVSSNLAAIAAVENTPKGIAYVDSSALGAQAVNVKVLYDPAAETPAPVAQPQVVHHNTAGENTAESQFLAQPAESSGQPSTAALREKLYQEIAAAKLEQMHYEQLSQQKTVKTQPTSGNESVWQAIKTHFSSKAKNDSASSKANSMPYQAPTRPIQNVSIPATEASRITADDILNGTSHEE